MSNGLHRDAVGQLNIHVIHAFEFADSTARGLGTGYTLTPDDVKKVALQLDDNSYWVLTDDSPITWVAIGGTIPTDITPKDGWIAAGDTWTYASADGPTGVFTITGVDRSAILTPGVRIKLTQTTAKYFIVTKVAFSSDTTVTVYGGTDYTLANAAITLPFYSRVKAPAGFNLLKSKWTETLTDSTNRSQIPATQNTWYNEGGVSKDVPIGAWDWDYRIYAYDIGQASGTEAECQVTLSTANNSESDPAATTNIVMQGVTSGSNPIVGQAMTMSGFVSLTAKTTYYMNTRTILANNVQLHNLNAVIGLRVRWVCAYL